MFDGNIFAGQLIGTAAHDHSDRVSLLQSRVQFPQRFPDQSLAAIALDRPTNPFAGDDGIAIGGRGICRVQNPDDDRTAGK